MYELKKNGKVFTSKSAGTGPSSCDKNNLSGRGLTKVEKHWYKGQQELMIMMMMRNSIYGALQCALLLVFTTPAQKDNLQNV